MKNTIFVTLALGISGAVGAYFWFYQELDTQTVPQQQWNVQVSPPPRVLPGSGPAGKQENALQGGLQDIPEEDRKAQMHESYAVLEQNRKDIAKRIARLKHEMWNLKFPREQGMQISKIMFAAKQLQQDGRKIGGFSDVKHIADEISRTRFALQQLEQVAVWVEDAAAP
ncbi:MAG: hypothetical protein ACYYK0_05455 [Candidatus Eutrophobiaceae bacterium]